MIADLNGDKAKETASAISRETGRECIAMACDVTRSDQIEAVVAATSKAFGASRRW